MIAYLLWSTFLSLFLVAAVGVQILCTKRLLRALRRAQVGQTADFTRAVWIKSMCVLFFTIIFWAFLLLGLYEGFALHSIETKTSGDHTEAEVGYVIPSHASQSVLRSVREDAKLVSQKYHDVSFFVVQTSSPQQVRTIVPRVAGLPHFIAILSEVETVLPRGQGVFYKQALWPAVMEAAKHFQTSFHGSSSSLVFVGQVGKSVGYPVLRSHGTLGVLRRHSVRVRYLGSTPTLSARLLQNFVGQGQSREKSTWTHMAIYLIISLVSLLLSWAIRSTRWFGVF